MSGDNGDNHAANGAAALDRGLPESRYLRMKAEIEADERALVKKRQQAERIKQEERDMKLYEVRQLITLYGFLPAECFPHEKNLPRVAAAPKGNGAARTDKSSMPIKFAWQGETWSGWARRPAWYLAAKASGVTDEQMMEEARRHAGG